jgi:pimeloyl-ACP methyl ester carboxylesterase
MERRRFLGALTAASLGVALDVSLTKLAGAQNTAQAASDLQASKTSRFPPNSTIVLVHGAWADGSCWRNVILPLEQRGLRVICAPIPMTSLTDDATALSQALDRTNGPVVLVGHVYSGAVIAAAREDRVKSLVYISALAPDEGETVAQVFYRNPSHPEAPKLAPDSHGFIWMPDDGFRRAVAHKASLDQTNIATSVQRPIAVPCIQEEAPAPQNETVLVPDRRRGSHDQSENAPVHGGSHARENPFIPCRPQPDVHGAKTCDQHNCRGSAPNALDLGFCSERIDF